MLLMLSTSSHSSAIRLSRSSIWSHHTQLLSLLLPITRESLPHSLQPETRTAACFCGSSMWVVTFILASLDSRAFCHMETTTKVLLRGWWSSISWASRVTTSSPHTLPCQLPCHALADTPSSHVTFHRWGLVVSLVTATPRRWLLPPAASGGSLHPWCLIASENPLVHWDLPLLWELVRLRSSSPCQLTRGERSCYTSSVSLLVILLVISGKFFSNCIE